MRIFNSTGNRAIEEAMKLVVNHIWDEKFLHLVAKEENYNYTKHSPEVIAEGIKNFTGDIFLKSYKSVNPFSRAIAYAELPYIYFNTRKDFSSLERAETIAHELMHLIGYSHNGNYVTASNLESVPYKVARIFKGYLESIK
jgi:hypothetical protein